MSAVKKLQDIHIEPLKISYVGSKNILSEKNKSDLIKILNEYQVFDNQSFKDNIPSISTEKAVLLLQISNKKLNLSHLDNISVAVLAKKVDQLAYKLLITNPKSFEDSEVINPITSAFGLSTIFSLKFIHSFENALLSSAKVGSSASAIALISDATRNYKAATKVHDNPATRFALFQGLYGTLQGILGAESLSLTFVNLIEPNIITMDTLKYTSAISGILTVAYLNIRSAFRLYRHNNIMNPIKDILKDKSISDTERTDQIVQYLQDQVSIIPKDIENTYKYALEASQRNKHQDLDPKAEKYLFMANEWYDKNAHKLLVGSEKNPVGVLELIETPFKLALANSLARVHENKVDTFEKYMGPAALKHIQSAALSNQELAETILKDAKSFRLKQYLVIAFSLLAAVSLAIASITTGGVAIGATVIFISIMALATYVDISNLLSKLKDYILTEKNKLSMTAHVIFSMLILVATIGIAIAMGATLPILISGALIAVLPLLLYSYILLKDEHQRDKRANESTYKILSHSL